MIVDPGVSQVQRGHVRAQKLKPIVPDLRVGNVEDAEAHHLLQVFERGHRFAAFQIELLQGQILQFLELRITELRLGERETWGTS